MYVQPEVAKMYIQPNAAITLGTGYNHIRNGSVISGLRLRIKSRAMICPMNWTRIREVSSAVIT